MRRQALYLFLPAFVLAFSTLVLSCNDESLPAGPSPGLYGDLLFRYDFGSEELGYDCSARGTIDLVRSAGTTTGTYDQIGECEGPDGVVPLRESGGIAGGFQADGKIRFETDLCIFEGTHQGNPPAGAVGEVACELVTGGEVIPLAGEWVVNRGVASIRVTPDSAIVPLDDDLSIAVTLLAPSGRAVEGWEVTWESSDADVATVDGAGLVVGVSEGEFTLRVTSVPRLPLEEPVSLAVPGRVGVKFVSVETGAEHTCGLTTNGRLHCWGRGDVGQLGLGSEIEAQPIPVKVPGRFSAVGVGYRHTCGVSDRGAVYCWGSDLHHATGPMLYESTFIPKGWYIALSGSAGMVAAGTHVTCAADWGWGVSCWGSNACGQLGCGSIGGPDEEHPRMVSGLAWPMSISLTRAPSGEAGHGCATVTGGMLEGSSPYCWGRGTSGQLGNGRITDQGEPRPVSGHLDLASISAGAEHTCGVGYDGTAYCWGDASTGALGTGSTVPAIRPAPIEVAGGHTFGSISAGDHFTCAVEHGDAYCWGEGSSHQLGNGQAATRLEPTLVGGGLRFSSVSAGGAYACGVGVDGMIYCWGGNEFGQLGTGDLQPRATPTPVRLE